MNQITSPSSAIPAGVVSGKFGNDEKPKSVLDQKYARPGAIATELGISARTLRRWAKKHPNLIHVFQVTDTITLLDPAEVVGFIQRSRVA